MTREYQTKGKRRILFSFRGIFASDIALRLGRTKLKGCGVVTFYGTAQLVRAAPFIAALLLPRDHGFVDSICANPKEPNARANARSDSLWRTIDEFRRFGHSSVDSDRGDLVSTKFGEDQVPPVPRADDRRRGRRRENRDIDCGSDARDLWVESAGYPEIAVGTSSESTRSFNAGELGDAPLWGDAGKFVHGLLGEPHVAIRASGNVPGK